jgi:hypothetical protein
MLQAFQGEYVQALSFMDDFAEVAVLIDQAIRGPGKVVLQLAGWKLGQRAHPQAYFV